jgi:hypothetical protein
LDEFLAQHGLLTIAGAIALGYAGLNVAQGASVLVLTFFADRDETFSAGPLTLDVGDRVLDFGQLVGGVVTLAVVLAAILYVVRPDGRPREEEVLGEA